MGWGLELCFTVASKTSKIALFGIHFSFYFGRGRGFYLRSACSYERSEVERRPFLSQALSNPTAREKLLHCVQVYLALSRRKF